MAEGGKASREWVRRLEALADRALPREIVAASPDEARRARLAVALAWLSSFYFIVAAVAQTAAHNLRAVTVDLFLAAVIGLAPPLGRRLGVGRFRAGDSRRARGGAERARRHGGVRARRRHERRHAQPGAHPHLRHLAARHPRGRAVDGASSLAGGLLGLAAAPG